MIKSSCKNTGHNLQKRKFIFHAGVLQVDILYGFMIMSIIHNDNNIICSNLLSHMDIMVPYRAVATVPYRTAYFMLTQ